VIAIDTNILVHAHQREAELHEAARGLIKGLAEGPAPWAICLHALVEFYAVVTHAKLWRQPSTPLEAFGQISAWRESPTLRVLTDDVTVLPVLADLVTAGGVRGAKVHDARIAGCCQVHGVRTLFTVDRDYGRFPALDTRNPFAARTAR
jgi:hypothetical protein